MHRKQKENLNVIKPGVSEEQLEIFLKNPEILKGMINQFNEFIDGDNGER